MTRVSDYPLLIEFVPGTHISREPEVLSKLPILRNGPPGTSVVFGDGATVPLPTDQIVFAEDGGGAARVGFGGMSLEGMALLTPFDSPRVGEGHLPSRSPHPVPSARLAL